MSTDVNTMQRAVDLYYAGQSNDAMAIVEQVLATQPNNADMLHLLGAIHLRAKRLQEAIDPLQRALVARQNYPEALRTLGLVYGQLGRKQDCINHLLAATKANPQYVEAHHDLGRTLNVSGNTAAALHHLKQAAALAPDNATILYDLGTATMASPGKVDEALERFERVIELKPEHADAHAARAAALNAKGRLDEAESAARDALRVDPRCVVAYSTLVEIAGYGRPDAITDDDLAHIRRSLDEGGLSDDLTAVLYQVMGDTLHRQGDYDGAWDAYVQCKTLRQSTFERMGVAFNVDKLTAEYDALMRVFDAGFFERTAGFALESPLTVYVVGMPRSGTTLVEQILAADTHVHGAGERHDLRTLTNLLPEKLPGDARYPDCVRDIDAANALKHGLEYLGRLKTLAPAATRVVDKSPPNFRHLGLVALLNPGARVIHTVRDPRDVALSRFRHNFTRVSFATDFRHIADFYRQYRRLMDHWNAVLPMPIHDVVYEDLVAEPAAHIPPMVAHVGVQYGDHFLNFHERVQAVQSASLLQVRQPIHPKSVGGWRHYEKHLAPFLDALGDLTDNCRD